MSLYNCDRISEVQTNRRGSHRRKECVSKHGVVSRNRTAGALAMHHSKNKVCERNKQMALRLLKSARRRSKRMRTDGRQPKYLVKSEINKYKFPVPLPVNWASSIVVEESGSETDGVAVLLTSQDTTSTASAQDEATPETKVREPNLARQIQEEAAKELKKRAKKMKLKRQKIADE